MNSVLEPIIAFARRRLRSASPAVEANRFSQLIVPFVRTKGIHTREEFGDIGRHCEWRSQNFPRIVAESALNWWQPGDPIATEGERVLCGVAPACRYDMYLLDQLEDAVRRGRIEARVDVFSVDSVQKMEDFEAYIPGVTPVYQTPAVGRWANGCLQERLTGYAGRHFLRCLFSLSHPLAG